MSGADEAKRDFLSSARIPLRALAHLDATVEACIRLAEAWPEYGGIALGNLFAFRDTKQKLICSHSDPVGPENDLWLKKLAASADLMAAAWGDEGNRYGPSAAVCQLLGLRLP